MSDDANGVRLTAAGQGALFTVPESDWTAISQRVGMTLLAKGIASTIAKFLPDFPDLVTVCQQWKDTTFPTLVSQSQAVATYAGEAIGSFTKLQQKLVGLAPDDPLPPDVETEASAALDELSTSTHDLASPFADLTEIVRAFYDENGIVDAKIEAYADRLGAHWQSIAAPAKAIDEATGRVMGAWQAIDDDLANVASGSIPITTPFLMGLGIDAAVNAWTGLKQEASAFPSLAEGQQKYLDGSWLGDATTALPLDPSRTKDAP